MNFDDVDDADPQPHHDHHSKHYHVFVNGTLFEWEDDHITPQQIRDLVGQGSDYAALLGEHGHESAEVLPDHKAVYLGNQHVHHFVTRPK
jgi:hypothetical protein